MPPKPPLGRRLRQAWAALTLNYLSDDDGADTETQAFVPSLGVGGATKGIASAYGCVNLVAESMAHVPRLVVDRNLKPVGHPVDALLANPHNLYDASLVWDFVSRRFLGAGNAYCHILRNGRGDPIRLDPAFSCSPRWGLTPARDRTIIYDLVMLGDGYGQNRRVPARDVLALHGPDFDGLRSPSTVLRFAVPVLQAIAAAQRHYGGTLSKALNASVLVGFDPQLAKLASADQVDAFLEKAEEQLSGPLKSGKATAFPPGAIILKHDPFTGLDTKLIDFLRWSVEDVCRIFSVPPYMVGHYPQGAPRVRTFEQQSATYVEYSVAGRCRRWDRQFTFKLLSPREKAQGLRIRSLVELLAKGTLTERIKAAAAAVANAGLWRRDEGRELTGKEPIGGEEGQKLFEPRGGPPDAGGGSGNMNSDAASEGDNE